jgi:D-alanine--poly(phosphoribitol) ligase subunit 1
MFVLQIYSSLLKYKTVNAFCIKNKYYSYGDLSNYVHHIYQEINSKYSSFERFGVVLADEIETYAAIIAILMSGKTYIPIHPKHPLERLNNIIEQSELEVILGIELPANLNVSNFLNISNIEFAVSVDMAIAMPNVNEASLAYILFTSGSTGIPKGVPITFANLDAFVNAFFNLGYQVETGDRFLQMFDLTFDLSVMSYLIPLCIGATVYTVPDEGMKYAAVYRILEEYEISFALMVPSIITYLKPYFEDINLPHLKYSLFCGEALFTDTALGWSKCVPNARIDNVYGPTEATIFCLTYTIPKNEAIVDHNGIIAIGKPMQTTEAIVVDEHLAAVPDNTRGELCLAGDQVSIGYLDAMKTREAFFTNSGKVYYRTGDVAFKGNGDNFFYCGRLDNQVKLQGFRIELTEIEFHLRSLTNNINVIAYVHEAPNGAQSLEAVFEETIENTDVLLDNLRSRVPYYMIPSKIHFFAPFPLNVNGKIDRKALKKSIY